MFWVLEWQRQPWYKFEHVIKKTKSLIFLFAGIESCGKLEIDVCQTKPNDQLKTEENVVLAASTVYEVVLVTNHICSNFMIVNHLGSFCDLLRFIDGSSLEIEGIQMKTLIQKFNVRVVKLGTLTLAWLHIPNVLIKQVFVKNSKAATAADVDHRSLH